MEKGNSNIVLRIIICVVLTLCFFALFICRLFDWQIVHTKEYKTEAKKASSYVETSYATRGEIRLSDGTPLAVNKVSYNVVLNKIYLKEEDTNRVINKLIGLVELCGSKWDDVLPIEMDGKKYRFSKGYEADLELIQSTAFFNDSSLKNANDVMKAFVEYYDAEDIKDKEERRNVISVRYNMEKTGFSYTNEYVFAKNIDKDAVSIISEQMQNTPGVEIKTTTERVIKNGTLIPHIVGVVGALSQEDYDKHKDDGYKLDDKIGKFGIEAGLEEYLRGKVGEKTIVKDGYGNVVSEKETKKAEPGYNVYLTINQKIQRAANASLASNINKARAEGVASKESKDGEDCHAGGAVMLDTRNNAVLAATTCPTYDLSLYFDDDYSNWLFSDESAPAYSRAFEGAFQPGSSFKPCVALAALQEDVITPSTTITCTQHYDYFQNFVINCLGTHGPISLRNALAYSCNYYFAEVGRRTGISTIYLYAEKFGLGEKTGLEVYESQGVLAGRDSENWYAGNTCQAAIGQSDNTFTPVQLATYVSTIANNGKRYRTHLVRKIETYDGSKTIVNNKPSKPELMADAELTSYNCSIVQDAMRAVCTSGTAAGYVGNYKVNVAGKTGTAENAGSDHCVFICYAPYEKPEVACAVVLEHGAKTKYAAAVAVDMMNAYFG